MNGGKVFVGPGIVVTPHEWRGITHFDGQPERTARSGLKLQSSVGLTAASNDRHDGPVAPAKDTYERLFINGTGSGAIPRMGMNPNPREFLGLATEIDLLVEELGHSVIRERNGHGRADLSDQDEVLDQ